MRDRPTSTFVPPGDHQSAEQRPSTYRPGGVSIHHCTSRAGRHSHVEHLTANLSGGSQQPKMQSSAEGAAARGRGLRRAGTAAGGNAAGAWQKGRADPQVAGELDRFMLVTSQRLGPESEQTRYALQPGWSGPGAPRDGKLNRRSGNVEGCRVSRSRTGSARTGARDGSWQVSPDQRPHQTAYSTASVDIQQSLLHSHLDRA